MLEDPAHQDVARWGKDGDTFVVVEVCHAVHIYARDLGDETLIDLE